MTTSMIERVARALAVEEGDKYEANRVFFDGMARAAIEAMRPIDTEDINYALGRATSAQETPMHGLVRSFWRSMIDKALES